MISLKSTFINYSSNLIFVGGERAGYAFSRKHFLSEDAMQATLSTKKEFAQVLADIGFVSGDYSEGVCQVLSDIVLNISVLMLLN